jgi:hypothetical protein
MEPMNSRASGAHLSTEDILNVWFGLPMTALRFWTTF